MEMDLVTGIVKPNHLLTVLLSLAPSILFLIQGMFFLHLEIMLSLSRYVIS